MRTQGRRPSASRGERPRRDQAADTMTLAVSLRKGEKCCRGPVVGPGSAAACADRREVRPRPVCRPGPLFLWEAATRQLPGPSSEGHPRSGGGGVARTRQSGPRAGRGAVVTWRVSSGARGDQQPPRAPFPDRWTELPRATKILLPASRIFIVRPRSPRDWPVQSETERTFLKRCFFTQDYPARKRGELRRCRTTWPDAAADVGTSGSSQTPEHPRRSGPPAGRSRTSKRI